MSWKKAIQNQINGMNIAKGGTAIRYQPIKVPKIDKPLLVIGLGGTTTGTVYFDNIKVEEVAKEKLGLLYEDEILFRSDLNKK